LDGETIVETGRKHRVTGSGKEVGQWDKRGGGRKISK